MNLRFSEAENAFRQEVRTFFETEYPAELKEKVARGGPTSKEDFQKSERALAAKGWSAPAWPKEFGGPGWTLTQRYIFDEELGRAGVLDVVPMGLVYFGPVLYTFGSKEQQDRWLDDILHSRTFWVQGYSEPNSGSDLASLQCKAERKGDAYIVNGEKIWTSYAQFGDWIFCLVRTDNSGPKHQGISFVCIDMSSPGIAVHPIHGIDGKHHLNRVTFENVEVPIENRIGEEGEGWHYATYLLSHERTSYAHIGEKKQRLAQIKALAAKCGENGQSLLDDPVFSAKLAKVEIDLLVLENTTLRILAETKDGEAPGDESSILKIMSTETVQAISSLYLELSAQQVGVEFDGGVSPSWVDDANIPSFVAPGVAKYLYDRAQTIFGGTNEIQRNVIAKRVLGL